ncbi:NAD-dependent protein deacetylase 1 [Dissostichus eleginoides]|uniref:NAD-dependent protein deacetylase 1 n=1 Tax=Dissostichus eleginoides TaxID=100907 RepID=A0AAD9FEQ3_DISEL|nr:NAD-dependent protein deacetylase 1 [Dissostichus eleginoides]
MKMRDIVFEARRLLMSPGHLLCSIRDAMVLSIQEKVRQMYPAQDIRRRELNSFAAQILNTIADAAASEMCALVEPQSNTHVVENSSNKTNCSQLADVVDGAETIHTLAGDLNEELGLEEDREQGPAVTLALPTPHDGPVVMTAAQDERTIRKREVKRKRRVQPFLVQKQSDAAACLKTQTENVHQFSFPVFPFHFYYC